MPAGKTSQPLADYICNKIFLCHSEKTLHPLTNCTCNKIFLRHSKKQRNPSPIAPAAKKCYYSVCILSYIKRGEIE